MALLDDYTKAKFPYFIKEHDGANVCLLAAHGERVFGFTYYGESPDTSWTCAAFIWNGQGLYWSDQGDHGYGTLDIPPPPARNAEVIKSLQAGADAARARLAEFPEAPKEWREVDERKVRHAEDRIAKLTGVES